MPEGDTVHKVGAVIRQDIQGQTVRLDYVRGLSGADLKRFQAIRVESVEVMGKHLLLVFANGWTLRVHLGMHGSWNRISTERRARPRSDTGVILEGPHSLLVCEGPKDVEFFPSRERARHPTLSRLGPDLLGPEVDFAEVMGRAERLCGPHVNIGDLLIHQQVACGLGNVYRNELCFLARVHPYRSWREAEGVEAMFRRGRELLQANLGGWPRTTTSDPRNRLWVYGRRGKPCLVCATSIEGAHQGDQARATQWCPVCQT